MTTLITFGAVRKLTRREKKAIRPFSNYRWVLLDPFIFEHTEIPDPDNFDYSSDTESEGECYRIDVPAGFLTDGASGGGPDYGASWVFHDWLYATHRFSCGKACTRKQADLIMKEVLKLERMDLYSKIFVFLAKMNPFGLFTKAWKKSGDRGPHLLTDFGLNL